mmetsp:Transcript_20823/g.28704  ORF Transcript_20823/g.28704 Transcript_20823/m.28704 type:complete len:142 (-) Transcript_20823:37-462(-)
MRLSCIFERLILKFAQDRAAPKHTGRPRALTDTQVVSLLFKFLRTGCQWRELDCEGRPHMAVRRRMELCLEGGVVDSAYARALRTYSKLCPPKRHIIDSCHIRNRHGRRPDTGRNHVDRGRQGTKISVITDHPSTSPPCSK